MMTTINAPLQLPCGVEIGNRICKGAMTEGLADAANNATAKHAALYGRWARGGSGILLTGNVQVDHRYLERPGNVVIEGEQSEGQLAALRAWAEAGSAEGTQLWMQISHAGRQTPAAVAQTPVAPSAVQLQMPGAAFGLPRALTGEEILDVIARFAHVAKVAQDTGFSGVQVHAAHGYLVSEFLSPDVNQRDDEWGGSLENRARLLLEIIRAIRKAVGATFPISVKLNSADFQKGGFSHADSIQVAQWLNAEGLDLLELSGGTYEQPKLVGLDNLTNNPDLAEERRESTVAREAYFLEYADAIRAVTNMPLLVTGGFRSRSGMNAALAANACDMVGIGRPLCVDPDTSKKLLSGQIELASAYEKTLRIGPGWFGPNSPFRLIAGLNGWGQQGWFCLQLIEMGEGREPQLDLGVFAAFRKYQANEAATAAAYHTHRQNAQ
ncbi:MAG: 2,4-dienoyl-CoA reductase-like NADH-dependent reductase (Old Yellow Enzyme family) [Paraglaciecola psychrophila]